MERISENYTLKCGCVCYDWRIEHDRPFDVWNERGTAKLVRCDMCEANRLKELALEKKLKEQLTLQRNELDMKRKEHLEYIDTIQHINFIPIQEAIDTYGICRRKLHEYNKHLNVVKIKNRWKCSKEKLELFNVQLMTNDIDYDALRRSVYQG